MKTKNNGTKKTWEVSSSRLCGETQSECSGKTWATHHKATSAVIWANWSKLSNHLNIINDGCKPWQCVTPNVQTVRTMNRILKTHLYDEQRVCSTLLLTCKLLKICWSFVPSSPAGLYPSRVKPMKRQQEPLGFRSPYTRQQTNQKHSSQQADGFTTEKDFASQSYVQKDHIFPYESRKRGRQNWRAETRR